MKLIPDQMYKLTYGWSDDSRTVNALYRGNASGEYTFWVNGDVCRLLSLIEDEILSIESINETCATIETVSESSPIETPSDATYGTCTNENGDLEIYILSDEHSSSTIVATIPSIERVGCSKFNQSITFSREYDILEFISFFPNSIIAYSITDEHHITIHHTTNIHFL